MDLLVGLLWHILLGAVVGIIARLIHPGRERMGCHDYTDRCRRVVPGWTYRGLPRLVGHSFIDRPYRRGSRSSHPCHNLRRHQGQGIGISQREELKPSAPLFP
jgi:hypothetical protein